MIEGGDLILLVVLGAWVALDVTSVAQVMVSRPLVSGTLAGAVLGAPDMGLLVGALIETAHLGDLPSGAVRLPEPGPAAIPAVVAAVQLGGGGGLAAGVGLGVAWAFVGGATVVWQRRLNGRLVRGLEEAPTSAREVIGRHWACVWADALRGATLVALGIGSALAIPRSVGGVWEPDDAWTGPLLAVPGALGLGILARRWSGGAPGVRRGAVFAGGALVGAILVTLS